MSWGALQAGSVAAFVARPGKVLAPDFRLVAEAIIARDTVR
jgi:hypothetical protein